MKTVLKYVLTNLLLGLIILSCENVGSKKGQESTDTSFRVVVVEQGRNQVKLFDSKGHLIDSAKVGYNPHEIELDSFNEKVYVSNFGVEDYDYTIGIPGTSLSVIDLKDFSNVKYWPTYRTHGTVNDTCKGPHGLKLRPPAKKELFVNLEYGDSMLVYDTQKGRIKRTFPLAKGVHNFEFSSSGNIIWSHAGTNGVYKYNATTGEELGHFPTTTPVRGMTFTPNQQSLILSCHDEIYRISTKDMSIQKHIANLGVKQIIYSCLGPDGRLLFAPCPYDNLVLVIDMETGDIKQRLSTGKAPIYVRIAPNGNQALVSNALDNHMSVINLNDYSVHQFAQVYKPNGFVFLKSLNE
ncbi:YncE family protein [Winogradskyella sp.]|uniref:YncE family protein n=1 Tax=Winogradskyella sp. TaxID=1883156 RepID=UPI003BA85DB2